MNFGKLKFINDPNITYHKIQKYYDKHRTSDKVFQIDVKHDTPQEALEVFTNMIKKFESENMDYFMIISGDIGLKIEGQGSLYELVKYKGESIIYARDIKKENKNRFACGKTDNMALPNFDLD